MSIERTHLSYLLLLAWKQSYEPQKTEAAEVYMKKTLRGTDKMTWTVLKMAVNSRGRRRAWNEHFTCKRQKKTTTKGPMGVKGVQQAKRWNTHTHTSPTAILHLCTVLWQLMTWWSVISQSDPQTRETEWKEWEWRGGGGGFTLLPSHVHYK